MESLRRANAPVVVGVDGSPSATRAAEWGAVEAARRGVGLRLVTAFPLARDHVIGLPGLGERQQDLMRDVAERQLAAAAAAAGEAAAGVEVSRQVEVGLPVGVLAAEAKRAQLLVLGDRGLGGLAGLAIGSVAVSLAAHGACPVAVVRGERSGEHGPVVVGVDGSPVSEAALEFAFEAAAAREAELLAVHAWWPPPYDEAFQDLIDWDAVRAEEASVLAERLAGWGAKYPDVPVRRSVVRKRPAEALVTASEKARLVVVGSRGRGNAAGLLLGSVSHAVLHRSHCPVAIVRPDVPVR